MDDLAASVAERLKAALEAGDLNRLLTLCAENVVFEFPFAPADRLQRAEGKQAVRSYLEPIFRTAPMFGFRGWTVHQTTRPEIVILEFIAAFKQEGRGVLEAPYIVVLTMHDGLVSCYRDYWSSAAVRVVSSDSR